MKPRLIVGIVFMVLFTSLVMYNFSQSISSFVDFEQAAMLDGNRIHVIGSWVRDEPTSFSRETMTFSFHMKDESGNVRRVMYAGPKPNNFEQADQLVVIGSMRNDVFFSTDMLVKCPSKYNDASSIEFVPAEFVPAE